MVVSVAGICTKEGGYGTHRIRTCEFLREQCLDSQIDMLTVADLFVGKTQRMQRKAIPIPDKPEQKRKGKGNFTLIKSDKFG